MKFELPTDTPDTAALLRELEPQAPKALKAVLIQAARELDDLKRLMADGAEQLALATALRIGQMDSASKAYEITEQIRLTVTGLAERMRALA